VAGCVCCNAQFWISDELAGIGAAVSVCGNEAGADEEGASWSPQAASIVQKSTAQSIQAMVTDLLNTSVLWTIGKRCHARTHDAK
jgi:hypothetical protein